MTALAHVGREPTRDELAPPPILLLGEDNPYGSDPSFSLYCYPVGCAGYRLRRHLGLPQHQYLALHRANLCSGTWSTPLARKRAFELLNPSAPWRAIVMLGRKVAGAFEHVALDGRRSWRSRPRSAALASRSSRCRIPRAGTILEQVVGALPRARNPARSRARGRLGAGGRQVIQPRDPGWLQTPLFAPAITWQPPALSSLPSWRGARRICLDVECRDDDLHKLGPGVRRGGHVAGIAFAIEDGPAHYLPIRHEGGGNLDEDAVWSYLRDNAALLEHEVLFNSAPYDLDYLWENRVEFKKVRFHRDVQVAEPVIDELQDNYNLDAICARRGLVGKDEAELRRHAKEWGLDPKKGLWRLHSGAVGAYATRDVCAPLPLFRAQEKEIDELGLRATFDLESQLTPVLMRMTRRGLRVDLDEMDRVEAWAKERRQDCIDLIHHLTGVRVASLANARELYPALKKRGLDVPTPVHRGTGQADAVNQEALARAAGRRRRARRDLGPRVRQAARHLRRRVPQAPRRRPHPPVVQAARGRERRRPGGGRGRGRAVRTLLGQASQRAGADEALKGDPEAVAQGARRRRAQVLGVW